MNNDKSLNRNDSLTAISKNISVTIEASKDTQFTCIIHMKCCLLNDIMVVENSIKTAIDKSSHHPIHLDIAKTLQLKLRDEIKKYWEDYNGL